MAYSTIPKGSLYMDTKLYTGNNSPSNTISGIPFAPDLIWIKARGAATDHVLFDKVRGVYKSLSSNDSTAENNNTNQLQTFTSDGWTMGDLDTSNAATTFASWNWKAGTAVSGSTTGSGTAKTYTGSVSTTSGFSIIKYIGNGSSGHTIPHNLNAVPKMIFVKNMVSASNWIVYNSGITGNKFLRLNTADTVQTSSARWNDTTPTSTVFTLGNDGDVNTNGTNYIAYCFAEIQGFSKIGGYNGNSSTDGSFTYTGFKPAFVFTKATATGEGWQIYDNKRLGYNPTEKVLYPNVTQTESTLAGGIDFLSNGFKWRTADGGVNSGQLYAYMAFAEAPLVGTNNTPCTAR